jgi:hypothetical protein
MKVVALAIATAYVAGCSSGSSSPPQSFAGADTSAVPVAQIDADRDSVAGAADCNDGDATVWRIVSLFPDTDRDGFGAGAAVDICAGSGTPAGYAATSADCAADDPSAHTTVSYAARDADNDTIPVAAAGTICGASATLPAGYFAAAASGAQDCDDHNASIWRRDTYYEDFDRDGVGHGAALSVCVGNTVPAGVATRSTDCDPLDTQRWRMVGTYIDVDGDGVGSGAMAASCVGTAPPSGSSFLGFDPLDTLTDPNSALVADFDLNVPSLLVEQDNFSDDIF